MKAVQILPQHKFLFFIHENGGSSCPVPPVWATFLRTLGYAYESEKRNFVACDLGKEQG